MEHAPSRRKFHGEGEAITEVLTGSKSRGSEKATFNIRKTDQIQFFPSESQSFRKKKITHLNTPILILHKPKPFG